jgi:hypothetical protein
VKSACTIVCAYFHAHIYLDVVMHEIVRRAPGNRRGGVDVSRKRRKLMPWLDDSSGDPESSSSDALLSLSLLEDFESLVDSGNFDSMPSIHNFLDAVSPLLHESNSDSSFADPQSLYHRIQSTMVRALDHSRNQATIVKEENRKKKESHSVSVGDLLVSAAL